MADVAAPADGFGRGRKRSVTIAGHETSIALEPAFWAMLEAAAAARGLPLNALVAQIDALRILRPLPPNLASALRTWSVETLMIEINDLRMARIIVDSANASQ